MKGGMEELQDESIPCAVDALKHNGLMVAGFGSEALK